MKWLMSPISSPTVTQGKIKTILKENSCSTFKKLFVFEIFLVNQSNKISIELISTLIYKYIKYTKHWFYKNEEKSEILYQFSQTEVSNVSRTSFVVTSAPRTPRAIITTFIKTARHRDTNNSDWRLRPLPPAPIAALPHYFVAPLLLPPPSNLPFSPPPPPLFTVLVLAIY